MSTGTRLAAFVAGLAVVFAGAVGVGRLAGPAAAVDPPPTHAADAAAGHGDAEPGAGGDGGATDGGHGAGDGAADGSGHGAGDGDEPAEHEVGTPGGLQVSERGYTLRLAAPTAPAGRGELAFAVTGPDGRPVTAYRTEHDKELHLIVVRRDLAGFRHLHPTRDAAGTWRTPVDLTAGRRTGSSPTSCRPRRARASPSVPTSPCRGRCGPARCPRPPRHHGRRLPGRAHRRAAGRRRVAAHADRHPGRRAGQRPAALPRRVRAPGRAAGRRPGLPARPPGWHARRRADRGRAGHRLRRRGAVRRRLPALPGLPARRRGAHRRSSRWWPGDGHCGPQTGRSSWRSAG